MSTLDKLSRGVCYSIISFKPRKRKIIFIYTKKKLVILQIYHSNMIFVHNPNKIYLKTQTIPCM